MEKLVALSGVVKSYDTTSVLTGIDLDIAKGELIVLLGPSGSGKTTLLNLIAGIDTANSGEILVLGKNLSEMTDLELTEYRRDSVGYIFQFYNLLPNLTVMENASLGLELKGEDLDYAKIILDKVGLEDKSQRFPAQLSGGEQQRVAIARSLINNPDIILADEMTGNLDEHTANNIFNFFINYVKQNNKTLVYVTHNKKFSLYADEIYNFKNKRLEQLNEESIYSS